MPSVSRSQQRLMGAAEHGADFPLAEKLRQSMSHQQLHDFAAGPMAGKPEHVTPGLPGQSQDVQHTNAHSFMQQGMSEADAHAHAIKHAKRPRHHNLGKYLHPRKDGKPHGSPREAPVAVAQAQPALPQAQPPMPGAAPIPAVPQQKVLLD